MSLLATHNHDLWDQFYLVLNRLTIVVACSFGAIFSWKRVIAHNLGVIPRPMWVFISLTHTLLVIEVAVFMILDIHTLSVFQRTTYGALLIYTIMGLLMVVKRGTDTMNDAVARAEAYKEVIQDAVEHSDLPVFLPEEEGKGAR